MFEKLFKENNNLKLIFYKFLKNKFVFLNLFQLSCSEVKSLCTEMLIKEHKQKYMIKNIYRRIIKFMF